MFIKEEAIKKSGVYENFDTQYYEFWDQITPNEKFSMLACSKVKLGMHSINSLVVELDNRWSGDPMLVALENTKTYNEYPNLYTEHELNIIEAFD